MITMEQCLRDCNPAQSLQAQEWWVDAKVKKILVALIAFFMLSAAAPIAYAHCPLCTAAVGAAAVSAKYYGMDISIIGLMIGAFGISTGLWFGLKLKKQFFKFQLPVIVLLSFLLTVLPLL